ncbi:MAG TPA: hypothetical protein VJA26_06240 [Gammaproteobacteria bacterium]|nr:hypothetical protein [Gammaproteobacteria bacterium]
MRLQIISICIVAAWPIARAQQVDGHRDGLDASLFVTSDQCIACHSNLHAASGEDVSIGYDWRASMMANAARDPYWHAAVRREVLDHPQAQAAIEDKCSTCHMPMARFDAAARGAQGQVFANLVQGPGVAMNPLATDGVSCTVCHQIVGDNFGEPESFDGGFSIESGTLLGARPVFGPHSVDRGRQAVMQSAGQFVPSESTHLQQSELCATCHTLYTHALNDAGEEAGELPEQVPYQEWLHSEYRETRSCQSCHMPELAEETAITSVLGQPRPRFSQHTFRGGNAFMLSMLNKYRGELGVTALPQELDAAIEDAKRYVGSAAARVAIESARLLGSVLEVDVAVASLAGHKLPTAYPSRRAWLHLTVTDAAGTVLFQSGALCSDGAIIGNDNDADAARFEPHYERIDSADQVQIYESIMVDQNDRVTTGLLRGVRYVKDNRLLPLGFDKASASADIAVHGEAQQDPDFLGGGDRVGYRIDLGSAARATLRVDVELQYQTIGRRWAENLRAYDAAETQRFVRYYDATAAGSAVRLAATSVTVPNP